MIECTDANPPTKHQLIDSHDKTNIYGYLQSRPIDYTRLRDLLAAGKLKEADQETIALMLKALSRGKQGWFETEDFKEFPCENLRTIDELWVRYSNGQFGFSVQQRIWENMGGAPNASYGIYKSFKDSIGWQLTEVIEPGWLPSDYGFTYDAPQGHLPTIGDNQTKKCLDWLIPVAGWHYMPVVDF